MRTVIVGDLQYNGREDISHIVNDIAELNADNVILLGDYGDCDNKNKAEEFECVAGQVRKLNVKNLIAILGNHDVQHEIMNLSDIGTAEKELSLQFGVKHTNAFLEFEELSIFCLGCECPPERNYYSDYECYISDNTLENLKKKLLETRDKPSIMVTHAPPACSGVINNPEVHLRASNAYLNQDHNYLVFNEIIKENPQIIAWFNGHYHMGYNHQGSISKYNNTYFFITGAPTSAARDGQHHSYIVDYKNNEFFISVYDHDSHKTIDCKNINSLEVKRKGYFVGCGKNAKDYIFEAHNGHVFLMTDNGFLWEIDAENNICLGTIHYSKQFVLDDFYVDDEYIWRICGKVKFGHKLSDNSRFMREYDYERCCFIQKDFDGLIDIRSKINSNNGWFQLKNGNKIKFINDNGCLCMIKENSFQ